MAISLNTLSCLESVQGMACASESDDVILEDDGFDMLDEVDPCFHRDDSCDPISTQKSLVNTVQRFAAKLAMGAMGWAVSAHAVSARVIHENPYVIDNPVPVIEKVGLWESLGSYGPFAAGVMFGALAFGSAAIYLSRRNKQTNKDSGNVRFRDVVWESYIEQVSVEELPRLAESLVSSTDRDHKLIQAFDAIRKSAKLFKEPDQISNLSDWRGDDLSPLALAIKETSDALTIIQNHLPDENHPLLQAMEAHLAHVEKVAEVLHKVRTSLMPYIEGVRTNQVKGFIEHWHYSKALKFVKDSLKAYMKDKSCVGSVKESLGMLHQLLRATKLKKGETDVFLRKAKEAVKDLYQTLFQEKPPSKKSYMGAECAREIMAEFRWKRIGSAMRASRFEVFYPAPIFKELGSILEDGSGFDQVCERVDAILARKARSKYGKTVYHDVYQSLVNLKAKLVIFQDTVVAMNPVLDEGVHGAQDVRDRNELDRIVSNLIMQIDLLTSFLAAYYNPTMMRYQADELQIKASRNLGAVVESSHTLKAKSGAELFYLGLVYEVEEIIGLDNYYDAKYEYMALAGTIYREVLPCILKPFLHEEFVFGLERFVKLYPLLLRKKQIIVEAAARDSIDLEEEDTYLSEIYERAKAHLFCHRYGKHMTQVLDNFKAIKDHMEITSAKYSYEAVLEEMEQVSRVMSGVTKSHELDAIDQSGLEQRLIRMSNALNHFRMTRPPFETLITIRQTIYEMQSQLTGAQRDLEREIEAMNPESRVIAFEP